MEVSEFWHSGRGPQRPQHIKNFPMGNSRNSFKYFLKFSSLRSNFSKKCKGVVFEICSVIDQVEHAESEYEVKPQPEVVFGAILAKNRCSAFFWGQYLRCYGAYESDIWGRILRSGAKYSRKISRS